MATGTCRYSFECSPFGYSKWPSRRAPVSRSSATVSSCVGIRCISSLIGPPSGENSRNRAQQDFPVQSKRPVIDVLHVHLHPGFEVDIVAAGDRPQTRET